MESYEICINSPGHMTKMLVMSIYDKTFRNLLLQKQKFYELNFSDFLKKLFNRFKKVGCNLNSMRQTACPVFNPFMADCYMYAALYFNGVGLGPRLNDGFNIKLK